MPSSDRHFRCPECHHHFNSYGSLKRHVMSTRLRPAAKSAASSSGRMKATTGDVLEAQV